MKSAAHIQDNGDHGRHRHRLGILAKNDVAFLVAGIRHRRRPTCAAVHAVLEAHHRVGHRDGHIVGLVSSVALIASRRP